MKSIVLLIPVIFISLAMADESLQGIAKKAIRGDSYSISKIFDARKRKDGNSFQDYQNLVEKVYKADPTKYVHVAFKYFNGDFSCAVYFVANEASNIDAVKIATKAQVDHSNDIKLKKFIKLLKQQNNAIKFGISSDYLDCK